MKKLFLISFALSVCLTGLLLTGCETESSSASIYITPDSASVSPGDSVQFTANGGYEYTWSLGNDSLGTLSTRTGPTTVYTSSSNSSTTNNTGNITQVLTVTSTIPDSGSGQTSTTDTNGVTTTTTTGDYAYEGTAQAYITHLQH